MSLSWYYEWVRGLRQVGDQKCASCRARESEEIRNRGWRLCPGCSEYKLIEAFGGLDQHGHLRGTICISCGWARRDKDKRRKSSQTTSRRRRAAGRDTYDGVTDMEILERDHWTCLMPRCLSPGGRHIGPAEYPDPWSRTIDHIIPIDLNGPDTAENKRPAHKRCNESRGKRISPDDAAAQALLEKAVTLSKLR